MNIINKVLCFLGIHEYGYIKNRFVYNSKCIYCGKETYKHFIPKLNYYGIKKKILPVFIDIRAGDSPLGKHLYRRIWIDALWGYAKEKPLLIHRVENRGAKA